MEAEGGAAAAAVGGDGDGNGNGVGASLIRELASCNKPNRDRALNALLKTWLPSQHQLSDDEMKKLWKGLFYCVWHSDKVPVQSHLVHRLSSLLLALPLPLSLHYLSVFLLTMRREWPGIDGLRLDKFYLLIRRFLHSSFLMLKKNYTWDPETSRRLMGVIEEKSFFADDKFLGNGVNYHIASIFIEELKPFLPLSSEIVDVMLKPFLLVMCKSQDKVLLGKVKSNMFDVLLKMGRSLLEIKKLGDDAAADYGDKDEDGVEVLGTIALTMGFSAKFFDLGSSPDCLQGNRKVLFSLHKDFLRLEKDLALAGIEVSTPDFVVEDEDEVPKLIPMVPDPSEVALEAANASAHEPLKKKKKNKNASDGSNDKAKALVGANKKEMKKKKNASDRSNDKAKALVGANKKEMKKKKKHGLPEQGPAAADKGDIVVANGEGSSNGMRTTSDKTNLIFSESVISNLQKQFENVAEGVDLDKDDSSSYDSPENTIRDTISKKRKRLRNKDGQDAHNVEDTGCDAAASAAAVSLEKSAKKVRFSIKNNLVWKPHSSPLPPQSLRLPPSVTPRGSALKKGTPPGPIREMPQVTKKKMKQKKKGRKGIKMVAPAVKRLRKLKTISI